MKKDVQSLKTIDILLQSLLFVGFALLLDERQYLILDFAALFVVQLLSNVMNAYLSFQHKRKKSRLAYALISIPYLIFLIIYLRHSSDSLQPAFFRTNKLNTEWKIPVNDILLIGSGLALAFWYFMICFREMKIVIRKMR